MPAKPGKPRPPRRPVRRDKEQLAAIATEIRRLRKAKALSLEQLAGAAGVSKSIISKVERGEATPTTTVLARLAEALDVTFSELMSPAREGEVILLEKERQPYLRTEGAGFLRRCLSPILPNRGIDIVHNTLASGASSGQFIAHRPGVNEYIWVERGRLRAVIGRREIELGPGDSLYFQAHVDHRFDNIGRGACEYYLVIDSARVR
jgi:transcriptional regulator with XRE-family HTH domain